MTQHTHSEYVPGCYRCELSADEAPSMTEYVRDVYAEAQTDYQMPDHEDYEVHAKVFDAWLSGVIAQAKAEALRDVSWSRILDTHTAADVRDMMRAEADRIEQEARDA